MNYIIKRFSKVDNREDASPEVLKKAKEDGVIQYINGEWRIVSIKKKKLWDSHYDTREDAEKALRAYHANHH